MPDSANALFVDNTGIYIAGTGNAQGEGGEELFNTNFVQSDVFVHKLAAPGIDDIERVDWTRQFGGSGQDEGTAILLDSHGLVVAGQTNGALPTAVSDGKLDTFIARTAQTGSVKAGLTWVLPGGSFSAGEIVYGADNDLYGVDPNTGATRELLATPDYFESAPAASREVNDRRIVYASTRSCFGECGFVYDLHRIDTAPADPSATDALFVEEGNNPSWDEAGNIAFDRNVYPNGDQIFVIKSTGTAGNETTLTDGSDPSIANGTTAMTRFICVPAVSCSDEVFIMNAKSGGIVNVTVSVPPGTNASDVKVDLLFDCGGTNPLKQPLATGLLPTTSTEPVGTTPGQATYEFHTFDPSHACGGSAGHITAIASDGWLTSPIADPNAIADVISAPKTPVAAIYTPLDQQHILQFQQISLNGTGYDAEDRVITDLTWKEGSTVLGAGSQLILNPPAAGWVPGSHHTYTLIAKDADGNTATDQVEVIIDGDQDNDGMSNATETSYSCLSSGVNDASNAFTDADGDGVSNADEVALGTNPCVAETSYNASVDYNPDTTNVPSSGNVVTVYVRVPRIDKVIGSTVQIYKVGGDSPNCTGGKNVGLFAQSWSVSNGVGTAKFDRQKLNTYLNDPNYLGSRIAICIAGRESPVTTGDPQPTFSGYDTTLVIPNR
jgi:hypothetical protein